MAGNIDKGNISKITGPNDWYGHPTRAQIDPCTNSGAITPALTIPWYLRGKMGGLKVGDCVAYSLFDDATGVILARLDGEWDGTIDYDTTTTGDVVNEKTELTMGHFTGTGGMTVSGGSGGASASIEGSLEVSGGDITADSISLKGHTHNCPHGGSTSSANGGSGGGGGDDPGGGFVLYYDGEYEVTPATTAQTLETAQRFLEENVEIKEIPYAETSNEAGGETAYIGRELE